MPKINIYLEEQSQSSVVCVFSAPRQVRFLLPLLFSLLIVVPLQTDLRDLWVVQQAEAGEVVRLKQVGVGAKEPRRISFTGGTEEVG